MNWYQISQCHNDFEDDYSVTQIQLPALDANEALTEYHNRYGKLGNEDIEIEVILPNYDDLIIDLRDSFDALEKQRINYSKFFRDLNNSLPDMTQEQRDNFNSSAFLPYFEE